LRLYFTLSSFPSDVIILELLVVRLIKQRRIREAGRTYNTHGDTRILIEYLPVNFRSRDVDIGGRILLKVFFEEQAAKSNLIQQTQDKD
jgi:hypothetical protein